MSRFRKGEKKELPAINTGSMSDIIFMFSLFCSIFLLSSSFSFDSLSFSSPHSNSSLAIFTADNIANTDVLNLGFASLILLISSSTYLATLSLSLNTVIEKLSDEIEKTEG